MSAGGGIVPRHGLFERLAGAGRVTTVSALAGSGRTVLLRSWVAAAGMTGRVAWVALDDEEHDAQRFWLAMGLDGWALAEQLLQDLAPLGEPLVLVVDDLHQLGPAEARAQLELLVLRSSPRLRFVFATRSDPRLGLHRLRLAGELTELRGEDLRFSHGEARALLEGAAGAFVLAADPQRSWYRYHRLFTELLRFEQLVEDLGAGYGDRCDFLLCLADLRMPATTPGRSSKRSSGCSTAPSGSSARSRPSGPRCSPPSPTTRWATATPPGPQRGARSTWPPRPTSWTSPWPASPPAPRCSTHSAVPTAGPAVSAHAPVDGRDRRRSHSFAAE